MRGHRGATTRRRSTACAGPSRGRAATSRRPSALANMSVDESGMGSREPQPARQGAGHPARRPAPEEHGRHRGDPGKGHRQVREARGRHRRRSIPGHQPVRHARSASRSTRSSARTRSIFSPHPGKPEDDGRDRSRHARARSAKLGAPDDLLQCVERPSIPLAQGADVDLRSDRSPPADPADGQGRLRLREAGLRRRRRQRHHGDRRDGGRRRGRAQHAASARRTTTDRAARPTATCSWTRPIYDAFLDQLQAEGGYLGRRAQKKRCCRPPTGTPRATARRHHRAAPRASVGRARGLRDSRRQDVPHRAEQAHRQGSTASRPRSSGTVLADLQVQRVRRRRSTWCGGSSRPAARGHSCGIYSFDDDHIHRLALIAPGQPDHGAAGAIELERRHVHQRHADDVEHGLRRVGRQHHEREHLAEALHERDLGEPADSRKTSPRSRSCSASSTAPRPCSRSDAEDDTYDDHG